MKSSPPKPEFRSALADHPAPPPPSQPGVGIIVPVYNEVAHIAQLAADLFAQDYPAISEIWFVDGQSTDGSLEALLLLQARDGRVRVISNPRRLPAAAINLALAEMRSDVVLRLDAHARYEPDVVRQSVEALLATGAGGVGAIQRPAAARTLVARSIVAAHTSRFGLGGARFRQDGAAGWVDSVWNGCYWRHVIDRVGPLREDLWRAEDNDFNERVRRLGYGLYLCPAIRAVYQPRQSLWALSKQYLGNGIGVAAALFENHRAFGLRHLLPTGLIFSLVLPLALAVAWPPALFAAAGVLALYGAVLFAATLVAGRTEPDVHLILLPLALATLHLSYGCGSLYGLGLGIRRAVSRATGRSRRRTRGLLCVALAAPWIAWPSRETGAAPTVWFVPSLERVGRDAAPGSGVSIELYAARGEYESFQIAIRAPQEALMSTTVHVGPAIPGRTCKRIARMEMTTRAKGCWSIRGSRSG